MHTNHAIFPKNMIWPSKTELWRNTPQSIHGACPRKRSCTCCLECNKHSHCQNIQGPRIWRAHFVCAWSGVILIVAALLYVDNTDLLHMSRDERISDSEFIANVQQATYYWAKLLQATWGNLKPKKCYWYLLSYKFVRGVATLKTMPETKHHKLCIPQPLAQDVVITLRAPSTAS